MFNWFKKQTSERPKTLGQIGEELAQAEYKKRGYEIIAANFFNRRGKRLGEVDFIAKNKDSIVFVEVKARNPKAGKFGSGAEAVDVYKQQKLLKAAKIFLLKNRQYQALRPQIDVCLINFDEFDKAKHSVIIIANAVEDLS